MAHEYGSVNGERAAVVELRIENRITVGCAIDTGFNGSLVLPRELVDELELPVLGRVPFETVGGALMAADVAEVGVQWLGSRRSVEVIVIDGDDALIGTSLLDGRLLSIDYVADTVTISGQKLVA